MEKKDADKQEKNRVKGRPFQKGVSGNINGRPKKGQAITDLMREYLDESDTQDSLVTRKEKLVKKLVDMGISGNLNAIRLILSYIDGLPHIRQEITYKEEQKDDEISNELLMAMLSDIREEQRKSNEYDQEEHLPLYKTG